MDLFRYMCIKSFGRVLRNVMSTVSTWQDPTVKQSLCIIHDHFGEDFNSVLTSCSPSNRYRCRSENGLFKKNFDILLFHRPWMRFNIEW